MRGAAVLCGLLVLNLFHGGRLGAADVIELEGGSVLRGTLASGTKSHLVLRRDFAGKVNVAVSRIARLKTASVLTVKLGGGKVLTLPVVIERTIVLDNQYAMGGALSAILLVAVLLINIASVLMVRRLRAARLVVA